MDDMNSNFLEGNGIVLILLFFILFGNNTVSNADIDDRLYNQTSFVKLDSIAQSVCDNARQTDNLLQMGFANTDKGLCDLGWKLQECCCETQHRIDMDGEKTRQYLGNMITGNELAKLRDELSQCRTTVTNNAQTQYILEQLGRYVQNPACPIPCYPCPCPTAG